MVVFCFADVFDWTVPSFISCLLQRGYLGSNHFLQMLKIRMLDVFLNATVGIIIL